MLTRLNSWETQHLRQACDCSVCRVLKLHVWPEDEAQQAQDQDFQNLHNAKVKYVHVMRDPRETVLLWANNKTEIDGSAKSRLDETPFKPLTYRAALVQAQFRQALCCCTSEAPFPQSPHAALSQA